MKARRNRRSNGEEGRNEREGTRGVSGRWIGQRPGGVNEASARRRLIRWVRNSRVNLSRKRVWVGLEDEWVVDRDGLWKAEENWTRTQ